MVAYNELFERNLTEFQPWLAKSDADRARQHEIQSVLASRAGASFGLNCYVAEGAKIATDRLYLGDGSFIAAGAIVRGHVRIDSGCSVNAYAHLAGKIAIGRGCRIASLAAIFGFNHGFSRIDQMIKDQPNTMEGVVLHEDIWVGASAIIIDGVTIGSHCVVAAGAVVTKSFPEFKIIAGNPARIVRDRLLTDR